MLAFVAPPAARLYIPPLRLPPLRGPVTSPYRPPTTNRPPGTQPAPIYQPPDFLPPTGLDLKGEVCIFANTPIWEPKKIRYRYPGEAWQEIAGESYLIDLLPISGGDYLAHWVVEAEDVLFDFKLALFSGFDCTGGATTRIFSYTGYRRFGMPEPCIILAVEWSQPLDTSCGNTRTYNLMPQFPWGINIIYKNANNEIKTYGPITFDKLLNPPPTRDISSKVLSREIKKFKFTDAYRPNDPPKYKCEFTVFDIFNNVILSITRDECPDVEVIPERCYFKPENERLVAKVFQSFLDPPLRIEYQGNCATVWKDSYPLIFFPSMIYKECTDNPNCPPPRIRLDNKKCKEECRQCPTGTAIKVLSGGGNIDCVDVFGCIIKSIKFKPGCNSYDCICG
jgi:hypothetical protein